MKFLAHAAWALLQPGHLLLLAFVAGWVMSAFAGTRRLGLWIGGIATLALVMVALLPVGAMALRPLENRFPPPDSLDRVDGIVILGGGQDAGVTVDRGLVALNDSNERMIQSVALMRDWPEARVVFSGGNSRAGMTEADVAREVFALLGADTTRVAFEAQASNTWDNAVLTRALVDPQPDQTWLLVTSAWHMSRAMATFRAAGWEMTPYPVDFRLPRQGGAVLTPGLADNLKDLTTALHEYVGLVAYRLLGRTDELFPAP